MGSTKQKLPFFHLVNGCSWALIFLWSAATAELLQPANATVTESYSYDSAGRLTQVVYDDGNTIQYNYDNNGNILSIQVFSNPVINSFTINAAMSDAWFFPATNGQGFFIIVWEDSKLVFLAWFTYDTERPPQNVTAILGEPGHRWLTGLGPFEGDTALLDTFLSSGMIFDSAEPPVTTEQLEGATIEIVWSNCKQGLVKYNIPSLGLSGAIPIQRIVEDKVAACEAAQAQAE